MSDALPDLDIEEFIQLDKRIDTAEELAVDSIRESLQSRWEFGQLMLTQRSGKQLRKGALEQLVEATGKSQRELGYRMQFAARYPTEDEVCNVLQSCTSWRQVIKTLPKPSDEKPPLPQPRPQPQPEPAPPAQPTPTASVPAEEETVLNWDSIPGTQREKVRAAVAREVERTRKKLAKEYDAYLKTMRAKYVADTLKATSAARATLRRDREALNKGIWTSDEYNVIRSCLHPDSRNSVTDEKLAEAFRLFNDPKIKTLLVREIGRTQSRRKASS